MADFPAFEEFYKAVHGRAPFPWQSRLADLVATEGWPREIGVPTGMGKTACIDIAVWHLAEQAATREAKQRTAPTRIWYVVNRRLLVSAALDLGLQLQAALRDPHVHRPGGEPLDSRGKEALFRVAEALRDQLGVARSPQGDPLALIQLRGGMAGVGDDPSSVHVLPQPPDPSHAALLVSTVPMYGSGLVFRGYGLSPSTRPLGAAFAGADCLVLLDEAHLSRPLQGLVKAAAQCDIGSEAEVLPEGRRRPLLVSLTATGEDRGERFDLDESDRQNGTIARRLHAAKPAALVEGAAKQVNATLAAQASALARSRPGSCTVVFCNTVRTARETHTLLAREWKLPHEVLLATGRVRPREAAATAETLMDPASGAPSGRDLAPRERSLLVVATQTLEVGADLDFDFLVTESASVRAITQRFGRLNRLGLRSHAKAVICHAPGLAEASPYGEEPDRVWERLLGQEPLNLGPASIADVLGEPDDEGARAAELLPSQLWEFAKTRGAEYGEPPVDLFFDELDDRDAEVSVAWRDVLPETSGGELFPLLREAECVDVPLAPLREALKGLPTLWRLRHDRRTLERVDLASLRPGDEVVLPADAGRYDGQGWNDRAREPVHDLSGLLNGVVWLNRSVLNGLVAFTGEDETRLEPVLVGLRQHDETAPDVRRSVEGDLDAESARSTLIAMLGRGAPRWATKAEWDSYVAALADGSRLVSGRYSRGDASAIEYVRAPGADSEPWSPRLVVDDLDELSLITPESRGLIDHCQAVSAYAGEIAARAGLDDRLIKVLRMAGRYHDLGKADERFQRWLDPDGEASAPVAKSRIPKERWAGLRAQSGWPRGGRHELLSARLLAEWTGEVPTSDLDMDLLLHLVLSHHGYGRPWTSAVPDPLAGVVSGLVEGQEQVAEADLSWIDWEQPARFRRLCERYGYWGLALLESILRKSDGLASGLAEVV